MSSPAPNCTDVFPLSQANRPGLSLDKPCNLKDSVPNTKQKAIPHKWLGVGRKRHMGVFWNELGRQGYTPTESLPRWEEIRAWDDCGKRVMTLTPNMGP